ncbi:MAG: Phospho-N-acetylmuramoyl-pentapeptide-transferase [candidate division TM6 bacterium GW2011_GWF2_30_66]|nr:MAG: Phospho-N-acetylmuramoyl-pentapeptide-transferase [candidate division TM6 bacterium GW2011_GWF2_30_66]
MLYHLSLYLKQYFSFMNVLHYVSFRAIAGFLGSLLFSIIFGQWFINKSQKMFRSKAREYTPENHRKKDDMPTMGGIFILVTVLVNAFIWCDLINLQLWVFLFCLFGFGAIGFMDDWDKINKKRGISAKKKFVLQCGFAFIVSVGLMFCSGFTTVISFPFFKNFSPDIGLFFIPWAMFIIVSLSNAVNLTDGLDGLAIGSVIPNAITFAIVAYLAGHANFASYLQIPFAASSEVAIFGMILAGASLGFLWYNAYPAQIFMGDVGSLALGASLALIAIMAKQEFLVLIAGGLFVVEVLSVVAQVYSFKVFGKRVLKMAPIHHHFELLGWPESKITVRFGIISLILCLLALITLKLR